MPRMRINGEVYEVPDSDVAIAQSQYGAVPDSLSPVGATGTNIPGAIAGAASAAVDAIGGARMLVGGGALGVGGLIGRHVLKNMRAGAGGPATVPAPAPAAMVAPPTAPAAVSPTAPVAASPVPASESPQGIEAVRRFLRDNPKRGSYSKIEGIFPEPPSKIAGSIGPKNVSRETSVAPRAKAADTVPIDVQGKPEAVRGVKQRGLSKRMMAERQGAAAKVKASSVGDDLMSQLAQSERAAIAMRGDLPTGTRNAMFRGIKSGAIRNVPGALGMLMTILDARSLPGQMDESDQVFEQIRLADARRKSPSLAAQLEQSLAFEKILTQRGFSEAQKRALRRSATEMIQGGNP